MYIIGFYAHYTTYVRLTQKNSEIITHIICNLTVYMRSLWFTDQTLVDQNSSLFTIQ